MTKSRRSAMSPFAAELLRRMKRYHELHGSDVERQRQHDEYVSNILDQVRKLCSENEMLRRALLHDLKKMGRGKRGSLFKDRKGRPQPLVRAIVYSQFELLRAILGYSKARAIESVAKSQNLSVKQIERLVKRKRLMTPRK